MSMLLVEGEYRIENAQPDGDSIRFYPDNPELWRLLDGRPVRTNKQGGAQLRLDAIDALETHFNPAGPQLGTIHQPADFGNKASSALLHFLGFTQVERDPKGTVTSATPSAVRGYILTRFSDTYGRVVAFAFKGSRTGTSGDAVRLEVAEMKRSWNYHALATGYAYPTFYAKLYVDLRKELAVASRKARSDKHGVWSKDLSYGGFTLKTLRDLSERAYIMPKLWRRLTSYVDFNHGELGLEGFSAWLERENDRIVILPDGHSTGFDWIVRVEGQTVKLTQDLENVIFAEK